VSHQRPADRAHLLLAAGHRPRLLRLALGETREQREDTVEILSQAALVLALEGAHLQVLEHRHTREELPALRRLGDAAGDDVVRLRVRDVVAAEADAPAARVVQTVDRAQRRRLAGAVRAEQSDDLGLPNLERDPLDRVDGAVVRMDVVELEDGAVGLLVGHAVAVAPALPRYASITRGSF
jgi:hypothetical protein